VYLAELIPAHPLYPAAQRLGEEISRLESGHPTAPNLAFPPPWTTPTLSGVLGDFPEAQLREQWQGWQAGLQTPAALEPPGLPADLEASRRWRYLQVEADQARSLAQVRAQESQRLAQFREQLVRSRLTELSNAGLDLSPEPATGPAANNPQQAQIWKEIEDQVQAEQAKSQARIDAVQQTLAAEAEAKQAEIDRQIQAEAASRKQQAQDIPELGELRQDMSQALSDLVARDGMGPRTRQLAGVEFPSGARQSGEEAQRQSLAAFEQTRQLQLQRLLDGQGVLLSAIVADTRRAVAKVAFEQNLRVHLIPTGAPEGRDLTAQVGERVRALWSGQESLVDLSAQEQTQP
jgi:hypothetical protein